MRIGIDIDDTIADTYEVMFAYAQHYTINELGRTGEIQNEVTNHHFYAEIMHNWTKEEATNFWDKYYEKIESVKPFTLAVEVLQKLKAEGNEIILITARWAAKNFDIEKTTLEWLKRNHIPYDEIEIIREGKAQVALDKKVDLFIDDSFKNCTEVANVGIKSYLMDTRTNKGLSAENVTRVYSWSDIYDRIKKEENINGTL